MPDSNSFTRSQSLPRGAGKPRRLNRYIGPYFSQLDERLIVRPGNGPAERNFHAADIAVIGVVDLRGYATDCRIRVAHDAHEQTGIRIEVELDRQLSGVGSLNDLNIVVIDRRRSGAPLSESLFDPGRKQEDRV